MSTHNQSSVYHSDDDQQQQPPTQKPANFNMNALQIHDKIMESLIRKYKPAKQAINFDPNKMTKEGLKEIGLEKIAKDLN